MPSLEHTIPPDLAERYRQLRDFDVAEVALVESVLKRPGRLSDRAAATLRYALNLARLWVVPSSDGELVVGPQIGPFRERLRRVALAISKNADDPAALGNDADALTPLIADAREALASRFSGRLRPSSLDAELRNKALVLALGGGGGCGYVHLGAFSCLSRAGIEPKLVAGSSLGSVLGLFRSREVGYREATVRVVTHGMSFKKLFRVLESDVRYGFPGTLHLYLRNSFERFFVSRRGDSMQLKDLPVPFIVTVTGVRREAMKKPFGSYEDRLKRELRRGAFGALLHLKDMATGWASLLGELMETEGALRPIPLGIDPDSDTFDALDAVGFSCALPALIHYDVLREDPRMHSLIAKLMDRWDVDTLVDGGIASNVPVRHAWEAVQRGRIGTRNAFFLGLDCFAPQLRRNMMFLPLQRIAAENVAVDRHFAHHVFAYRKVLSPAALVPDPEHVELAIRDGRDELEKILPFIRKMLEPIPESVLAAG
ncbi:MAG: patatin-like phospholipase family protein [Deltaproteobacteria bacterium]|nr:patatin-like phospholipase family protein [Deltaproteobacteria bacterium]